MTSLIEKLSEKQYKLAQELKNKEKSWHGSDDAEKWFKHQSTALLTQYTEEVKNQKTNNEKKVPFVGIVLFDRTDVDGSRTWDFVHRYPSGGAGHTGHLSSLAEQVGFDEKEFTLYDAPPEEDPGRGLIKRWFVPLPQEWKTKFLELYKATRAGLSSGEKESRE